MAFSFSSDSEVLKINEDYQELLRTLACLEAQKIQAIQDLETLGELKDRLNEDPCELLRVLSKDNASGGVLPQKQTVIKVPDIDWTKYRDGTDGIRAAGYNTRQKGGGDKRDEEVVTSIGTESGRKKQSSGSYGKPWTEEEQSRLEELLKIYPPEDVEARRWQKIATALGNRTTKQVCCRVQKYFIKLAKAGLPVPGRMPNLATYTKKSRIRRSSTRQPSLFFHSLKPRVYMTNEGEEIDESHTSSSDDDNYESTSPVSLDSTLSNKACIGCHSNLDSVYWSCNECDCLYLCLQCVKSNWSSSIHLPSHDMLECLPSSTTHPTSEQYIDKDYTVFKQSSSLANYNYLDPNFHPAL